MLYLPRDGKWHYSDYTTWRNSPDTYIKRFFHGQDNLNTKAIEFGSFISTLLEHDPLHPLVSDIPKYGFPEYDLECILDDVPIFTHPDDVDADKSWGVYEFKTALWKGKPDWTTSKVYRWKQIAFYQMCILEKNGWYNAYDNYIVEIPTQRIDRVTHAGLDWEVHKGKMQQDITRAVDADGKYIPAVLHRRIVPLKEIIELRADVIKAAHEVSDLYKKHLFNIKI